MSYRTILVQLNNEQRAPALVALAREIAREFECHLVGLYVFPAHRVTPPIPLPFGADVEGRVRRVIEDNVARVHAAFKAATANLSISTEWRAITSERRDACDIVAEHARAADLVIASQSDPDWDMSSILDFPDRLAIESGRPVLIVPNSGRFNRLPQTVVVGWNNRREAARAIADALPLMQQARSVHIATIEEGEGGREGQLPDAEIASSLARHGIKCQLHSVSRGALTAGERLRTFAVEHEADMLVMGAYGHSRFRELAFGGATRHLLRDMTIPVLFSH